MTMQNRSHTYWKWSLIKNHSECCPGRIWRIKNKQPRTGRDEWIVDCCKVILMYTAERQRDLWSTIPILIQIIITIKRYLWPAVTATRSMMIFQCVDLWWKIYNWIAVIEPVSCFLYSCSQSIWTRSAILLWLRCSHMRALIDNIWIVISRKLH